MVGNDAHLKNTKINMLPTGCLCFHVDKIQRMENPPHLADNEPLSFLERFDLVPICVKLRSSGQQIRAREQYTNSLLEVSQAASAGLGIDASELVNVSPGGAGVQRVLQVLPITIFKFPIPSYLHSRGEGAESRI